MSDIEIIIACLVCYSIGYLMGMVNKYLTKKGTESDTPSDDLTGTLKEE